MYKPAHVPDFELEADARDDYAAVLAELDRDPPGEWSPSEAAAVDLEESEAATAAVLFELVPAHRVA